MKLVFKLLFLATLLCTVSWLWLTRAPSTSLVDASGKKLTAGDLQDRAVPDELSLIEESRILAQRQEYDRAKELLLQALEETDHDGEACILLCEVTLKLKQIEESTDYGLKATQLLPGSSAAHLAYAESLGAQLAIPDDRVGAMLKKLALMDRFKQECVRAIELDDTQLKPRTMLGFFYLMLPQLMGGDPEKAMDYFREVNARDPMLGGHLVAFGLAETNRVEEALDLCAAKINEYPEDRAYLVTRASILERNERYDEADLAFEAARPVGAEPDEAYFRSLHGQASSWIKRKVELERAVALLDEFLATERPTVDGMPSAEDAYWRQGQALEMLGRLEEASAAYRAALELEPTHRDSIESLESLSDADGGT